MEKLKYKFRQIPAIFVATILITLTLFTGVSTIVKASKSFGDLDVISVPEVKGSSIQNAETERDSVDVENTEVAENSVLVQSSQRAVNSTPTRGVTPTPSPSAGVSAAATVDTTGKCIISVFGKSYDVTPLQTTHAGGNVFVCGSDNTSLYQSAHGTNVSKIAPYLVTVSTASPNTGNSAGTSITSRDDDDDEQERENEENEFEDAWKRAKEDLEHESDD